MCAVRTTYQISSVSINSMTSHFGALALLLTTFIIVLCQEIASRNFHYVVAWGLDCLVLFTGTMLHHLTVRVATPLPLSLNKTSSPNSIFFFTPSATYYKNGGVERAHSHFLRFDTTLRERVSTCHVTLTRESSRTVPGLTVITMKANIGWCPSRIRYGRSAFIVLTVGWPCWLKNVFSTWREPKRIPYYE